MRLIVPLFFLCEFLSHKEQFLSGMRHHIAQERPIRGELFFFGLTAHLLQHGAFSVDDLVMRNGENVVLRETVEERERQLVVVERPVDGVEGDVAEHIVHPAHVPLEVESQTADVGGFGDHGPCCGFLCDHEDVRIPGECRLIQMPQEVYRLQVLVTAVNVGTPFAVLPVVVQIEHGCHCVHPESVQMEVLQPAAGAGDQERAYLAFAVVKYSGSPALVFHFQRIGIFIAVCAIEFAQPHGVFREVCRNPVQDDADACLVEQVDHFPEVVRRAVP